MKSLLLGGAGFIGSHLVDYQLNQQAQVVVVDNLSTGRKSNIEQHLKNPNFHFIEEDILNCKALPALVQDCDQIYILAALVGMFYVIEYPVKTLETNIQITDHVLRTIQRAGVKPKILLASSSEVYGSSNHAMKENQRLQVASTDRAHASYVVSKLCNEVMALTWYHEYQLPLIVARLFNTVGLRQSARYGMVLPRFIHQALTGEPLTIFSDGTQTRSFCDVRDVCVMLSQLMEQEASYGKIINVGHDEEISILNLAKQVLAQTQSSSRLSFQDYEEAYGHEYLEIQHRKPDLHQLRQIIGYTRQFELHDTIATMIESATYHLKR